MASVDEEEQARAWVAAEVATWRGKPYADLLSQVGENLHVEMTDDHGNPWIRETQIFWDDAKHENIRVRVDVWNPRKRLNWSSLALTDFIRAPNGSFVGE